MTRLRRLLSDLALLPAIWRRLVREQREGVVTRADVQAAILANDRAAASALFDDIAARDVMAGRFRSSIRPPA